MASGASSTVPAHLLNLGGRACVPRFRSESPESDLDARAELETLDSVAGAEVEAMEAKAAALLATGATSSTLGGGFDMRRAARAIRLTGLRSGVRSESGGELPSLCCGFNDVMLSEAGVLPRPRQSEAHPSARATHRVRADRGTASEGGSHNRSSRDRHAVPVVMADSTATPRLRSRSKSAGEFGQQHWLQRPVRPHAVRRTAWTTES